MVDFLGIGAQKAGTSWIYSCLYEHPEICMPRKEIHFFSRDRYEKKGIAWYESLFEGCPKSTLKGEFCTSYLCSAEAAGRIYQHYPDVKMIAVLRNPVNRAFSNYLNDIRAGLVSKGTKFGQATKMHDEYLQQGYYSTQITRFLEFFNEDQLLILIYEQAKVDAGEFIRRIYRYLKVDDRFIPSMLFRKINASYLPKWSRLNRSIDKVSDALRSMGMHKVVWYAKKTGFRNIIRKVDTVNSNNFEMTHTESDYMKKKFAAEVKRVEDAIGIDLKSLWYDYREYI